MFGQKRLMDWLSSHSHRRLTAGAMRDQLSGDLDRFRGGAPMGDDQAFLMLTEEGGKEQRVAPAWWNPARLTRRPNSFPVTAHA
jgi:hypothetical protein